MDELLIMLAGMTLGGVAVTLYAVLGYVDTFEDEAAATRAHARGLLRLAVEYAVETGATWIWRDKRDGANAKVCWVNYQQNRK